MCRESVVRWFREDHLRPLFITLGTVALVMMVLTCSLAKAADATLTWTHPTQRVDNTPIALSEIKETQIDWGLCTTGNVFPATPVGTKSVPAPATTTVVTGLAYGTWCFRARTVDTLNEASANSGTVWKQWLAPPKPPVLSPTITVAYEFNMNGWGEIKLGKAIGTIKEGATCVDNPIQTNKGEYYEIDLANVELYGKQPKSSMVLTKCEWRS